MTEDTKVPCTQKDLKKVEEIFSNVIAKNLSDSKLSLSKIQQDFHNLLTMNLVVQPSPEDDVESQRLKSKIEKNQLKAIRIKSNLEFHRNRVIGEVKTLIDGILQECLPEITPLNDDDFNFDVKDAMSEQFRSQIPILDQCIQDLLLQLKEETTQSENRAKKLQKAGDAINSFINSNP